MFRFLKSLFELPDVETYSIPEQPRKKVVVEDEPKPETKRETVVDFGKAWNYTAEKNEGSTVHNWETADGKTADYVHGRSRDLTKYDYHFLREKFSDTKNGFNLTVANVAKDYWARGYSAKRTEDAKRDANKKLQAGYSEREIKKYQWSFNRALEAELEDSERNAGK